MSDEAQRLSRLRDLLVLDSPAEPLFDRLARLASTLCGTPVALLSLVDEERQWFKAKVGLTDLDQTPRNIAFCSHAIEGGPLFEVPDAQHDPRFAHNPLVTGGPQVRFYAGAPLTLADGHRMGTLCVLDHQPRQLTAEQSAQLQELAQIATEALVMRRDLIVRALSVRSGHEQALAASDARHRELAAELHDLYDQAPCGYHSLDADGRFVQLNTQTLNWLGCRRDEVLNRLGPADFFSDGGRHLFHLLFPVLKAEGQMGPVEFELRSRDGTVRWVSITASAIRDAQGQFLRSRSVMYDVTEVHEARNALHRLSDEQRAMLDNDVVGIAKVRDGLITWHNPALAQMLGFGPDELLNQPDRTLYPDDASHAEVVQAAAAGFASQGRYRTQQQLRHQQQRLIWVDMSGARLSADARESMWVLVDISHQKAYQQQVEHIAFHDSLTGLPNRLLLADRLKQAVALAERQQHGLALCYLDLDGFKAVNDHHGHGAGDNLLAQVAGRLLHRLRQSDTAARLGGDEFVLLLSPIGQGQQARQVLERIIEAVQQPVTLPSDAQVRVTASIGVAMYPEDERQPALLMARADRALYEAKRAGKNRLAFACDAVRADDAAAAAGVSAEPPAPGDAPGRAAAGHR